MNMTRKEYRDAYKAKGWTRDTLTARWGYKSNRRIHQIGKEVEEGHVRAQAHLDKLRGLPHIRRSKK
jgi:hypothetical protein